MKSDFVEYPHYPIACCFPHLCMVAHHCHSRKKTSRAKRKRLTAKFLRCREDIFFSFFFCHEVILFAVRLFFLPWGYSFCHESFSFCREAFHFALRFLFLPWGFSFCCEVFLFALRFSFLPAGYFFSRHSWLGHHTFKILFTSLDFFQHVGIRAN